MGRPPSSPSLPETGGGEPDLESDLLGGSLDPDTLKPKRADMG
jgi:hypothetical protein